MKIEIVTYILVNSSFFHVSHNIDLFKLKECQPLMIFISETYYFS